MRKALALLLAWLTVAQPVIAATDPPLCGSANAPPGCEPYQSFRTTSRFQRVAIIKPSRWDVVSVGIVSGVRQNLNYNLGTIRDEMRLRGLEVHEYTTDFFERDQNFLTTNAQDKREMWSNLGAKYALAIVLSPVASTASFSRYICADSTNVQIVVIGGGGSSWADTTVRGIVDDSDASFAGTSSARGSYQTTSDGLDSLWGVQMAGARRIGVLPSGVQSVVRVLVPRTTSGVHWLNTSETALIDGGNADSTTTNMPASAADTLVASAGLMGSIWRVQFTNNLLGAVPTALNGVSGGGPNSVYWIKTPGGVVSGRAIPHYLWALVCRFTTAAPIPWAFDWDDVADQPADSKTLGGRLRPTVGDTALAVLRTTYGITPSSMVNPGHMNAYLNGTTPYFFKSGASIDPADSTGRRESYWISPTGMNYMRRLTWIHHAHDSTSQSIASNLVGGFGGYASGNHFAVTENGVSNQIWNYRLASTWQPTGARTSGFFGIVQRLQWSDSLRRIIAPEMRQPPYLTFPANQMLPKNWKARTLINSWDTKQSLSASCPLDSLMWAFHKGLVAPGEKLWLRYISEDPRGSISSGGGIVETGGINYQWDRDSVVASTVFLYPNERFVVPPAADGRRTETIGVHSFLQGASGRNSYMDASNGRLAKLMGLKNPVRFMSESDLTLGFAYSGDAMAFMTAGAEGVQDWNGMQATRVVYAHPIQNATTATVSGIYDIDQMISMYFSPMRALDKIAGRPCTKNVPAWQVYDN